MWGRPSVTQWKRSACCGALELHANLVGMIRESPLCGGLQNRMEFAGGRTGPIRTRALQRCGTSPAVFPFRKCCFVSGCFFQRPPSALHYVAFPSAAGFAGVDTKSPLGSNNAKRTVAMVKAARVASASTYAALLILRAAKGAKRPRTSKCRNRSRCRVMVRTRAMVILKGTCDQRCTPSLTCRFWRGIRQTGD
jgi:hypothetical protein